MNELSIGQHSMYIHVNGNCNFAECRERRPRVERPGRVERGPRAHRRPARAVANPQGQATFFQTTVSGITVGDGGPTDVVGHAVVVQDRLESQPGGRIRRTEWLGSCGVIKTIASIHGRRR